MKYKKKKGIGAQRNSHHHSATGIKMAKLRIIPRVVVSFCSLSIFFQHPINM